MHEVRRENRRREVLPRVRRTDGVDEDVRRVRRGRRRDAEILPRLRKADDRLARDQPAALSFPDLTACANVFQSARTCFAYRRA